MAVFNKRDTTVALVVTVGVLVFAFFGGTEYFGAHPFWALRVGYVGAGLGLIVFFVQRFWQAGWLMKTVFWAAMFVAAYAAASIGKARFAASFAEDAFAGRMWFFGWFALVAMAVVLLAHLFSSRGPQTPVDQNTM